MGNHCPGPFSASARKLKMLNGHLEKYNTRIAESTETLGLLSNQEAALIHRIRRAVETLRRKGPLQPGHTAPGSEIYRMATELADCKSRIRTTNAHLMTDRRNRHALNTLIQAEDQTAHVSLSEDLAKFGLTLGAIQEGGEKAHLASAELGDLAEAAEPTEVAETTDIGALLAAIINGTDPVTAVYATDPDSVNAAPALASGHAPLSSASDDHDDHDAASSVVLADSSRQSHYRQVVELGD